MCWWQLEIRKSDSLKSDHQSLSVDQNGHHLVPCVTQYCETTVSKICMPKFPNQIITFHFSHFWFNTKFQYLHDISVHVTWNKTGKLVLICNLIAVYGEGVIKESNVRKWCWMFNEDRTNVYEEQSRRPSLVTEDLKNRIDQNIRTNRSFTLYEIHKKLPHISHSLIHEIVTGYLHCNEKKLC